MRSDGCWDGQDDFEVGLKEQVTAVGWYCSNRSSPLVECTEQRAASCGRET